MLLYFIMQVAPSAQDETILNFRLEYTSSIYCNNYYLLVIIERNIIECIVKCGGSIKKRSD